MCPACPQPLKNLPDNWKDVPNDKRWLYALFVAINANFCLKRHIISKDSTDSGLSCGWVYFVNKTAYKVFDTRVSHGLAATGVGTIDYAQHNMKLPNGVRDLYRNMDYLFFTTLHGRCVKTLNVSYDIACQWHKYLWFFMPKFHLPAHIFKCQTTYSFNFLKNIRQADGEAPECGWSNINPVASSTKKMGPVS
ncbi:hypothetical protein C8R48DRAFT_747082 [Suillus tomentosus]|nr:hypothetical protein C8R48DRAFT_747082 [Suillus tomentosus]